MTTATRGPELTYGYIGDIVKYDKNDDGTIYVYGKAAGPDLDLDGQRMDPVWLKTAMPKWMTWGNVREQHSNIAAGVGVELTEDGDDWYLKAHIVDPTTVKKVVNKVLKGFSGGIVNGRVVKSKLAPNGVINDGEFAEISLVDRPCNPTNMVDIAKSADGVTLEPVDAPQVGDIDEDGDEVIAVIEVPEPVQLVEKSIGWYREALRLVEDALAGTWSHTVPFITKAAQPATDDEHADVAAAQAAIDQILDLVIAEAGQAKGGRIKELRDIQVLLSAAQSLCCFIDGERGEDEDDGGDHGHDEMDMAYSYKAAGAWGEPDAVIIKSVTQAQRDDAQEHGDTMPDGSYPITSQTQLDSALHLVGHSKTYSRSQVMAHIRRQAKKHGLSLPVTRTGKAAGDATVDGDTTEMITKAVQAAQAEFTAAHEAEVATLRADLEKALAAPKPGGPVTFKRVNSTSSAPAAPLTEASPEYWRNLAKSPAVAPAIARAYQARADELDKGAST